MPDVKPTSQQQDFLDSLVSGVGHLALVARAGCGKTSTILMGVDALVENARARGIRTPEIVVCAFNKAIADEVKGKLIARGHTDWKSVSAATLHSLGFGLLKYAFKPTVDDKKVRKLIERQNAPIFETYRHQIETLVRVAKQAGVGFFNDSPIGNVAVWHQLADHYDINGLDDTSESDAVVEAAQHIYRMSLEQTNVVDFDDMILLPLVKNMRVRFGKDVVFLDEAQDLSRARQALARKFLKPGGRMVVVGDDRQAIYGFSGADAAALHNMIDGLSAKVRPLSITWRCPKAVVREAQAFVPDIEAAPNAPEGEVVRLQDLPDDIAADDAILCRNTAPLITLAYKLIRSGKVARVEGRAIGEGLINLVGRWKVATIASLLDRLETYRDREIQKAMARGSESKAEEVGDRVDTVVEICNACIANGKTSVNDVRDFIENLFADGVTGAITLATYHRSKGREWGRVFLWEHASRCPSRAARQDWQRKQEDNLAYVAITRAQRVLAYVG